MITETHFCTLRDGRQVHSYTIANRRGESVTILDYGATIHAVHVLDRTGALGDVVLGASPEHFEASSYRGGTIGRCANRIAYGRCRIGGKEYQLERNLFGHFLHGASGNYAEKLFTARIFPEENRVTLYWHDTGAGGFDCDVQAEFSFSFDDESRLTLCLRMTAGGETILNPTNHAYFNLSEDGDARDHQLWIGADRMVTRSVNGLPNGGQRPVAGTPADFTRARSIREAMEDGQAGYFSKPGFDEFYLLDGRRLHHAATLYSPRKGRTMRVYTDMPCLVLFCGGGRECETGKYGKKYAGYCAVCLETGFVPNAVNCPEYDSPVFAAGETLTATTVYQFSEEANTPEL